METVAFSPTYPIAIPRLVREAKQIEPGQKVQVRHDENRIALISIGPIQKTRSFLRELVQTLSERPTAYECRGFVRVVGVPYIARQDK